MTMKDFFKWWYTNPDGVEYMTFGGCSINDTTVIVLTLLLSIAVITVYLMIGLNAYKKSKKYPKSLSKSYLLNMMNVFLLCAFTGYGYTVLSVYSNPYKLRILLLFVLFVVSYRFYKSIIKSNIIEQILERENLVKEKIMSYNKLALKFQESTTQIVSWETLKAFRLYEWINIDGIRFMKVKDSDNEMVFITEMEAGATFGMHMHDCKESIEVLEGELIDDLNYMNVQKSESCAYEINVPHAPYSNVESIYKVTFKKSDL